MVNAAIISFLFDQAFGVMFLILGLILMTRADYYRSKLASEDILPTFFSATTNLLLSIFLVLLHSVWVDKPRVVVSIICWLFLFRVVMVLAAPELYLKAVNRICSGRAYFLLAFLLLLVGVKLLITGFFIFSMKSGVI